MITSYHIHTIWSDGEAEIADYVAAAREIGLAELGISDHFVLTGDGAFPDWAMDPQRIGDYVADIQSNAVDDFLLRLGIEVDYLPETAESVRAILARYPFDYVIGSVHFVDEFPIDSESGGLLYVARAERDEHIRAYWVRLREMAESGLFDIAGHLDLTKKYGVRPTIDISREISDALDAIKKADMTVELNTSGWYKACQEPYPEPAILRGCLEREIPIIITADAHLPGHLTRGYEDARRLIREIGFREIVSYEGRRRIVHELAVSSNR